MRYGLGLIFEEGSCLVERLPSFGGWQKKNIGGFASNRDTFLARYGFWEVSCWKNSKKKLNSNIFSCCLTVGGLSCFLE